MKTKQNKIEEDEYLLGLYKAKVEVAIARWQLGEYPRKEPPQLDIQKSVG